MGRKPRECGALELNEESASRRRLVSSVKCGHRQGHPPSPGQAQLTPAFILTSLLIITSPSPDHHSLLKAAQFSDELCAHPKQKSSYMNCEICELDPKVQRSLVTKGDDLISGLL